MNRIVKTNLLLFVLWAMLMGTFGCEAPFVVDDSYTKSRLMMESISSPEEELSAMISVSIDVNHVSDSEIAPKDVNCILTTGKGDQINMLYAHRDKNWRYYAPHYYPEEGESLKIIASLSGYTTIVASTIVPYAIKEMTASVQAKSLFPNNETGILDAMLHIDLSSNPNLDYATFNARLIFSPYQIIDGEVVISSDEFEKVKEYISVVKEQSDATVYPITYKPLVGSIVDLRDEKVFDIAVNSSENIPEGYMLTGVEYSCTSINEAYYRYIKSFDLSTKAVNSSYSEPVVNFSNVYNGMGVFGGMSTEYKVEYSVD